MKILIVTIAFPPRNSPGALRPYSWAKYWSQAGHQVTVLTTKKGFLDPNLDFSLKNNPQSPYRLCEVDFQFWKKNRPVNEIYNSNPSKISNTSFKRLKEISRMLKTLTGPFFDFQLLYVLPAIRAGIELAREQNIDVMISTYPPGASHWIARGLKNRLGIPWVADFRDPWGLPEDWEIATAYWGRLLERKAIARADLLIGVAEQLRLELARRYDIPSVTLENGFDPDEFDNLDPTRMYPEDGKLRFIYAGAIYGKRNPEPLFAAIQEIIRSGKLTSEGIELIFYGRSLETVLKLAGAYGLSGIVKTPGLVDHNTVLRVQRDADGLLFLEGEYAAVDYVLPVKIFEYLRSGKPVLGIGMTKASVAGQLMLEAGVGFPLGSNSDDIRQFILTNYIDNKEPAIRPNRNLINSFSREILAQRALLYLESVVKKQKIKRAN